MALSINVLLFIFQNLEPNWKRRIMLYFPARYYAILTSFIIVELFVQLRVEF